MPLETLIIVGLVLVTGSALQSATGFGFGMFAIPLLIVLGQEPYTAIAVVGTCAALQMVIGIVNLRAHVRWPTVLGMVAMAGVMIPIGVVALERVSALDPGHVRQVFGAIVLAIVLVQWLWRVRPHERVPWPIGAAAMATSGFMAGLAGMGGPPAVMWVLAHRWSTRRARVTLWALFLGLTPIQLAFLARRFGGAEVASAAGLGAMLAPFTIIGIVPGLWLGHQLAPRRLRQLSYTILALVSLYAITQPLL